MRDFGWADFFYILSTLPLTLALSAATFAGGMAGGMALALARSSESVFLRALATGYIRLFQGTPLLIQMMIAFFAPSFFLGTDVSGWTAALIALTLNASAYAAEIIRGCIDAVPRGQREAARALGLSYPDRMRDVILPQALRIAIPPLIGLGVQLIKGTSLASVVGFIELTKAANRVNQLTFEPIPAFGTVCLAYFIICWPLSLYGRYLERRLKTA